MMLAHSLAKMGLCAHITNPATIPADKVARVFTAHRDRFLAQGLHGEIVLYLPGKLQFADASLTVGDWCLIGEPFPDESGKTGAIVEGVLPRATTIERAIGGRMQLIAANVDLAFIVTSANHDLNINRLQRYLLLARSSGVTPIIVLSKADLADDPEQLIAKIAQHCPDVEILATAKDDAGSIEPLKERLAADNSTGIFLGSSGVGKSTLVNQLMADEVQDTGGIREDDSRGRHTTSHRELFTLPSGGLIIDCPGLRELSVAADGEDIDQTFATLKNHMARCKFRNCSHQGEPGCAVDEGIAAGTLEQRELDNFKKLEREAAFHRRRNDKAEMANSKKRWKAVNVANRKRKKKGF